MESKQSFTVRLSTIDHDHLRAVSLVEERSMQEIVVHAVEQYVAQRRATSDFQRRLGEVIEKDAELLRRLAT